MEGDEIREEFDAPEVGEFAAFLVVGKDGTMKLKVSEPISTGELVAIVDSMPMRADEDPSRAGGVRRHVDGSYPDGSGCWLRSVDDDSQ